MTPVIDGLAVRGRLIVVGVDVEPIEISPLHLIGASRGKYGANESRHRGDAFHRTDSSNPPPSSKESANFRFLNGGRIGIGRAGGFPPTAGMIRRRWSKLFIAQPRGLALSRLSGQDLDSAGAVLSGAAGRVAAHQTEPLAHYDMKAEPRHAVLSKTLVAQFLARVAEREDFETCGG